MMIAHRLVGWRLELDFQMAPHAGRTIPPTQLLALTNTVNQKQVQLMWTGEFPISLFQFRSMDSWPK